MKSNHGEHKDRMRWVAIKGWWPFMFLMACIFFLACPNIAIGQEGNKVINPALSLLEKYRVLQKDLNHNQFQRPVHLDSTDNKKDFLGEIYAVVDFPFAMVSSTLNRPPQWCDILNLHLNIKYCHAQGDKLRQSLSVYIGRKYEQPLVDAAHILFEFEADTKQANYLKVILNAENGPYGTRNNRIMVEAVPFESNRTFIHLAYSYEAGFVANIAMQYYFNTLGSGKVGFSVIGKKSDGEPIYTGDMRGLIERNTMRYYLAIEAYLNSLSAPLDRQLETRLENWFAATERYPLQLHELERNEYLAIKHKEYQRHLKGP